MTVRRNHRPPTSTTPASVKTAIACLMVMIAVATVFMTQPIFLEIATTFRLELSKARLAFSVTSLCYSAGFFFIGSLADRFNLPKMAVAGLVTLSVMIFLASLTTCFPLFLMAMGLIGFSAALIPAALFPHMALVAPKEKLGLYVGAIVASGTVGVVVGRVAIGLLTAQFGWPVAFRLISVLLFILAALGFFVLVEQSTQRTPSPLSIPALYLRSIKLLFSLKTLALLVTGFFLFFGFLGMLTIVTYRLVAPPFLFTTREVGWISLAGFTALIAPFSGALSQKTGIFKVSLPGLFLCLVAVQFMGWFNSVPVITLGLILLFAGTYCCQPLLFLLIGQSVPKESLGSASSLYIVVCIGGGSLSSIVLGPIWTAFGWSGVTLACTVSLALATTTLAVLASGKARRGKRKGETASVGVPIR
jgi:MFS transporter, YNFM family, putative membrane transport protein